MRGGESGERGKVGRGGGGVGRVNGRRSGEIERRKRGRWAKGSGK